MRRPHPHFIYITFILISLLLGTGNRSHADLILTEFCASNDGSLLDEDGDASDWIEIRNSGSTSIDLTNWSLTDEATNSSKWVFPSMSLPAGDILVIFASGKNRTTPGSELHTNFALSQSGEYLALVSPSSIVTTEFSPSYPAQVTGKSYGYSTPSTTEVLISETDSCKVRIPDSAYNASVGNTWRDNNPSFDASSWTSGTLGVGYERSNGFQGDINLDVESLMYGINTTAYIRIPINLTTPPSDIVSLTLRMKYDDGFAAFVNGSASPVANSYAPASLSWNSASVGGNPEASATIFEDFDISSAIPTLVSGTNNVLAIQGLNHSSTSSDALFRCELIAQVADSGSAALGFFDTPTPGTVNGSESFLGFLSDTNFSQGRGIFYSSFTETISCPDLGSTIIYTTDGSLPSLTNGTQILPANANTSPSGTLSINTTTVLRAIAVKNGYQPTNVDTQTYLFPDDVLTQSGAGLPLYTSGSSIWDYEMDPDVVTDPRYNNLANDLLSLPTLSIVMPVDDVWGTNGVYRNPTSYGSAWERACSVEVLNPDGSAGYQVDGGLRIQGSGSRRRAIGKKSMRLAFRKEYGSSRFKYPLWGPTGPAEVANLVLRGSYFDSWTFQSDSTSVDAITRSNALQFRTHFATIAHARTGKHTIASNWVHLYINGIYWGPYNTHERPDAEFAEYHLGGDEDDYTVIKTSQELVQGSLTEWNQLMALCSPYNATNHSAILGMIDQDQFIDYIFMNIWGGNNDWPHNNWYTIRNNLSSGPFLFYVWDPENYVYNTSANRTTVSNSGSPGIIYDRLRRDTEFQVRFGDRVHKLMFNGGPYTLENMQALWQEVADELEPAMNAESARWGDEHTATPYNTQDHWLPHVSYRKNTYMPTRHNLVLSQLRSVSLYPNTDAPVLSQHGGTIVSGQQVSMTNPNGSGTLYFTTDGSDPRLAGGFVAGTASSYSSPITLTGLTNVKARVRSTGGEWSALTNASFTLGVTPSTSNIAISEIHYNPADATALEVAAGFNDKDDFEFIELMNTGSSTLDLSTLTFDNSVEGIDFDFSSISDPLLAPGDYIVLAKNTLAYAARYGSADDVAGNFSGRLSNSGETITLTQAGSILLSFTYNDDHPWPDSADGQGASLVLLFPLSNPDHNLPENWRASAQLNGTPAFAETLPPAPINPLVDADGNGLLDIIDYAVKGATQFGFDEVAGSYYPALTFTVDPLAEEATTTVQHSTDMSNWSSSASLVEFLSETYNSDGTITYQWRGLTPSSDTQQFLRVKVESR